MKKDRLFRLSALAVALCAMFALAACSADDDVGDGSFTPTPAPVSDPGSTVTEDGGLETFASGLAAPTGRVLDFEPYAPSFEAYDARVDMIEVNQGLSWGFDTDTGEYFLMENFVAGKETAVFVTFYEEMDWDDEIFYLEVERGGIHVATLSPFTAIDEYTLLFHPKNMAEAGDWARGAYLFTLYIDDDEAAYRMTNFYQSTSLKVLAVPILGNFSGEIVACEGDWTSGATMLYATYPIARSDIEYVLGPELDLTDWMYDLDDEDCLWDVWNALCNLQTPNNDYDLIIGFVGTNPLEGTNCGFTFGSPANIVTESDPDMLATVIHEIAHCYKIGDEYPGGSLNVSVNAPPYGMDGHDINTQEYSVGMKPSVVGGEDYGLEGTGSVIYADQRPYWVEGRQLLGYVTSYMGSGVGADSFSMWKTSDIWNHLFNVFTGVTTVEPLGGGAGSDDGDDGGGVRGSVMSCPECFGSADEIEYNVWCQWCDDWTVIYEDEYECEWCGSEGYIEDFDELYIYDYGCGYLVSYNSFEAHNSGGGGGYAAKATGSTPITALDITGFVENGAFTPDPWYSYESVASELSSRRSGDYSVVFYDADGEIISTSFFNLEQKSQFRSVDGDRPYGSDRLPVDVTVEFPDGAAAIALLHGDDVIYETLVSANAPEVFFTGLSDYDVLGDTVTLTWDASDADGDDLWFEIWYLPSDDDYHNIAANITGNSFEANLSSLPGTEEGYFYIFATDGVLTTGIDSPWVEVQFRAPSILSGQDGIPEYKITEEITLDAEIYDLQDGWLWGGDEVVWMLDGREFMSGSFLWVWPYELAPGTHTFTCVATNSAGMSAEKEFTFVIIDDESDLPDDWSREHIKNALSNGFITRLDMIDSPITRGQYATLMSTLFVYFAESDDALPDYVEGLVTDCGNDDYEQFLMVYLGLMDAPGGIFSPGGALSQSEAAVIMYRVMEAADPDYMAEIMDLGASDDDIIDFYLYNELMDEGGDNAFAEDERLTNRLALVRLSLLFDAVFG